MGNNQLHKPENTLISQYDPPLQQYKLKHCGINFYVWQHCIENIQLIQFPLNIYNEKHLKQQFQIFLFRHKHNLLVSNEYFRYNQSTNKASVFYERVFTNLSRIKDLPFEDCLLMYYTAFKGFQVLYRRFGYFDVQEGMFHITRNKKLKIWCHKDISKLKPRQLQNPQTSGNNLNDKKGIQNQQTMLKKILKIIQQNSDCSTLTFPIGATIYEHASHSFSEAIQKLRQICTQNFITIPEKLSCIDVIGKGEVGMLLDQYGQVGSSGITKEVGMVEQDYLQKDKNCRDQNVEKDKVREQNQANNTPINAFLQQLQIPPHPTHKIVNVVIPLTHYDKKAKGIQVTNNFQKPNLNSENINYHQSSKINSKFLKDNNKQNQPHSPIKQLDFNYLNSSPVTTYYPPSSSSSNFFNHLKMVQRHHQQPQANLHQEQNIPLSQQKYGNVVKKSNSFQYPHNGLITVNKNITNLPPKFGQVILHNQRSHLNIQNITQPSSVGVHQPVIRKNSLDSGKNTYNNNIVAQIHKAKPQYQIYVNYVQRPSSSVQRTTNIVYNVNTPPIKSHLSPSASVSQMKHIQNLRNIQNAYKKTAKNLSLGNNKSQEGKQNTNTLSRCSRAVIKQMQLKNANAKNEQNMRKDQDALNTNNIVNQSNDRSRTTILNKLKSYESTYSNTLGFQSNQNTKIQQHPPQQVQQQSYQNFKTRFDSYKNNFNFSRKETKYDPKYEKHYLPINEKSQLPNSQNSSDNKNQKLYANLNLQNVPPSPTNYISYHKPTYSFSSGTHQICNPYNFPHQNPNVNINRYINVNYPPPHPQITVCTAPPSPSYLGLEKINQNINKNENKLTPKPFFTGILNGDTVVSYPDSNSNVTPVEKYSEIIERVIEVDSQKGSNTEQQNKKNANYQFPSNTDISDNVSYIPNSINNQNGDKKINSNDNGKTNKSQKNCTNSDEKWREQSFVVQHDPNTSKIKLPQNKQYSHQIDNDIWEDMQKVRAKVKKDAVQV